MAPDRTKHFDIKRYLAIIQRRRYIALIAGLLVLSLFTWGSFIMPKTYEASTTISIERDSVLEPLIRGVGVQANMDDRLRNLRNEITSRSIIEKVIKKLALDANVKDTVQYEALIEKIRKALDVTVRGGGPNLLNITYKDEEPKKVVEVVNTLANTYIEEQMFLRRTDTSEAYEFIHSQLLEYKNKLEESDKAIREFKERNPKLIPQSETTILSRLEGLESQRMETEIRMKELMQKRDSLKKQLSGEKELTVAIVTREGSPQARLNYLNNQLMLLLTKYTENYPEVIKVKQEIEELKKQIAQAKESKIESPGSETATLNPIYQQLKEDLTRTEAEIESLRGRQAELIRQQQEIQKIFGRLPKEQEEWTKLQRDRNVYQQLYDQLLQRLENARVSKEIELTNKGETFRIVDPAIPPIFPVKPDRVKMILLGIFLGIGAGIGVVFLIDYFDHSLKDEETIEENLKIPVLATIPKIITKEEEIAMKRFDRKIYVATGAYLIIVGIVFVDAAISRYLGITLIGF